MANFFRVILLVLACAFSASAMASFPPVAGSSYNYTWNGGSGSVWPTVAQACQEIVGTTAEMVVNSPPSLSYCKGGYDVRAIAVTACPANSSGTTSCTCSAGYVEDGNSCVPANNCAAVAGNTSIFNVTAGYNRSSQGVANPPFDAEGVATPNGYQGIPPSSMCVQGCLRTRGNVVASWTSSEPTPTGLYRMSDDWQFTATATQCTESGAEKAQLNPTAAVPPCVGFLGEINGKKTCVATSSGNTTQSPNKPTGIGNPQSGSTGGTGGIPSSGGNGGNSGGPAAAGDGDFRNSDGSIVKKPGSGTSAPTGTTAASAPGEQQTACGAPGQAKCGIDETGTPQGTKDYGQEGFDGVTKTLNDTLAGITSSTGKDTSWGVVPTWLTRTSTCTPSVLYTLPAFVGSMVVSIDLCPHLPLIYALMNLLWVVWTFGAVISMVFTVTTAKGS